MAVRKGAGIAPAAAHERQPKDAAVERAFRQLPDEAVVNRSKDRADSSLWRASGREEALALT
jgi:hypothetical protein